MMNSSLGTPETSPKGKQRKSPSVLGSIKKKLSPRHNLDEQNLSTSSTKTKAASNTLNYDIPRHTRSTTTSTVEDETSQYITPSLTDAISDEICPLKSAFLSAK